MDEILAELGYRRGRTRQFCLTMVFVCATGIFLALGYLVSALGVNPVLLHVAIWAGWFIWQGHFFGQHRQHYLSADPTTAYRRAFRRDILPGVTLGVSQMVRPVWGGVLGLLQSSSLPHPLAACAGVVCGIVGIRLLYLGFRTIGFDGAGFLYEYKERAVPLTRRSIYAFIRHPLFLGGVLASVGASLLLGGPETLVMAAINIAVLPIYERLEDARLTRVFGNHYLSYRSKVGGFVPRFRLVKENRAAEDAEASEVQAALSDSESI